MKRFLPLALIAALLLPAMEASAQVVARVGALEVTLEELDQIIFEDKRELDAKIYELRKEALHKIANSALIQMEATAQGVDTATLIQNQVSAQLPPISDEQVADFMAKNGYSGDNMGERVRHYLTELAAEARRDVWVKSLADKYGLKITLEKPAGMVYQVQGPEDLLRGNPQAPVTIVEFSDFQCPYCQKVQKNLTAVQAKYGDQVKLVFRHFPLDFHVESPKASEASQCASEQGKFWPYHDALFAQQDKLDLENLKKLARDQGLDGDSFDTCLDSGRHTARVDSDVAEGRRLGITGTPTFFINGQKLVGAVPVSRLSEAIDEALSERPAGKQ